jgi:hypothetical protein
MFQRIYAIALNAFVETIRQPLYGVILLTTTLLMVLNVSLAAFTLDDDNKLLLDLGLSTLLLSGLFLSAFSASGVLSQEIENKTVLTVISKPVSRPLFVLGKYAGLAAALWLAFYLSFLVFVLSIRHGVLQRASDPWDAPVLVLGVGSLLASVLISGFCNYFYGKDFPTMVMAVLTPLLTMAVLLVGKFDEHWKVIPFGSNYIGGQVVIAAYLVLLAIMITAAVALAASTRLGQLMTLVICSAVVGLGVISDNVFGKYEQLEQTTSLWANPTSLVAGLAYRVVPNINFFWVIDGLNAGTEKTTVTLTYIIYATAYATLIVMGVLSIAVAAFQKREVG